MVCICVLMVIFNLTYRKMQNEVPSLDLPWKETYPDHTWRIAKTFKSVTLQYLESILHKTALMRIRESDWKKGLLATDSTGVETDLDDDDYEKVRPNKKEKKFEKVRIRRFLKLHVVACSCCTRPSGITCI